MFHSAVGLGFDEEIVSLSNVLSGRAGPCQIDKARSRPINITCRASTSRYKKQLFLVGYASTGSSLKSPTVHTYRHGYKQHDRSVTFLLNHIALKCLIVVCELSQKSTNITTNNKKNPPSTFYILFTQLCNIKLNNLHPLSRNVEAER